MERKVSLSAHGIVLVQAVEFRRLHLFQGFLAVSLGHCDDCLISSLGVVFKIKMDLLLVAKVGISSLLNSEFANAGKTSSGSKVLMSLLDLVVEQRVSLAIFILFSHDPLHRDLVAVGICGHSEESILFLSASGFIIVLLSVNNVAIGIVFTNIVSADRAD